MMARSVAACRAGLSRGSRGKLSSYWLGRSLPPASSYPSRLSPPGSVDCTKVSCPVTEQLCQEVVWLFHPLLLGDDADIADISRGFEKVVEGAGEVE